MIYQNPAGQSFKSATTEGPWTPISNEEYDERLSYYQRTGKTLPQTWQPSEDEDEDE